jgi:Xaa-Pro dipeptidase
MCRTYAVGRPSPALREAVDLTIEALELAEPMIVPGGKAADVDQAIREFLAEHEGLGGGDYFNLTGHGLGLAPHEAPWILTDSDDFFELGDVVAVEPALYGETLNGGARTEDNYVVLADGVKNLCSLPRRLM